MSEEKRSKRFHVGGKEELEVSCRRKREPRGFMLEEKRS